MSADRPPSRTGASEMAVRAATLVIVGFECVGERFQSHPSDSRAHPGEATRARHKPTHEGNQELRTGVLTMAGMGRARRPIAMLSAATHGPAREGFTEMPARSGPSGGHRGLEPLAVRPHRLLARPMHGVRSEHTPSPHFDIRCTPVG